MLNNNIAVIVFVIYMHTYLPPSDWNTLGRQLAIRIDKTRLQGTANPARQDREGNEIRS